MIAQLKVKRYMGCRLDQVFYNENEKDLTDDQ